MFDTYICHLSGFVSSMKRAWDRAKQFQMSHTPFFAGIWMRHRSRLLPLLILPFLPACSIMYPNRMFDETKDYAYQEFLDTIPYDFTLEPGDKFELYILPEKGYNLIESQIMVIDNVIRPTYVSSLSYSVSESGLVNIPIVGIVSLGGLSELEAEKQLMAILIQNYTDPFVNVNVTSDKIATVFRGSSESRQVKLPQPNMTVLQVIAAAGGMPENAKASRVKIIRNIKGTTYVESLDLSTITSMQRANYLIHPNDVIYIEPGINPQFFKEVAPIITALSGIVVIYAYFTNLNSK